VSPALMLSLPRSAEVPAPGNAPDAGAGLPFGSGVPPSGLAVSFEDARHPSPPETPFSSGSHRLPCFSEDLFGSLGPLVVLVLLGGLLIVEALSTPRQPPPSGIPALTRASSPARGLAIRTGAGHGQSWRGAECTLHLVQCAPGEVTDDAMEKLNAFPPRERAEIESEFNAALRGGNIRNKSGYLCSIMKKFRRANPCFDGLLHLKNHYCIEDPMHCCQIGTKCPILQAK
jgi:Heterogeneous nuclear ribonucleoprotein Q acidic domain